MSEGVRLHLGCGNVHRAGYVNVDRFDSSVADMLADVLRLPFANTSVEGIEAFHLIEHLDYAHCRYALSEWFRVLKEGATLVIETPNMSEAFKRFVDSDVTAQERDLSWIYGIDSPGMQHKTGFSQKLLVRLLETCGFADVRRQEASTHLYEPGMRIVCRRPKSDADSVFASELRHRLLAELAPIDSYVMVPLERHVDEILSALRTERRPTTDDVLAIAAKMTVVNPGIAVAVLGSWQAVHGESAELADFLGKLRALREERIHEKALALWMRARKDGPLEGQSKEFTERLGRDILGYLGSSSKSRESLSYLAGLEPESIPMFDLQLVLMDARLRVNRGVRRFAANDLDEARTEFEAAAKENPENLYSHWNLARLEAAAGSSDERIQRHYETAVRLSRGTHLREDLEAEARSYRGGRTGDMERGPVNE